MKKNTKNLIVVIFGILIVYLILGKYGYVPSLFGIVTIETPYGQCTYQTMEGSIYSEISTADSFVCKYEQCILKGQMIINQGSPIPGYSGQQHVVLRIPPGETGPRYSYIELDSNNNGQLERYNLEPSYISGTSVADLYEYGVSPAKYPYNDPQGGAYIVIGNSRAIWIVSQEYTLINGRKEAKILAMFNKDDALFDLISPNVQRNCLNGEICSTNLDYSATFNFCPPTDRTQDYCSSGSKNQQFSSLTGQVYTTDEIVLKSGEVLTFKPRYGYAVSPGSAVDDKKLLIKNCQGVTLVTGDIPSRLTYGDDLSIPVTVLKNNEPQPNVRVDARIEVDGEIKSIPSPPTYTNTNGTIILNFRNIEAIGNAKLYISSQVDLETKQITKDIYFGGRAVSYKTTTESEKQSGKEPVTFLVELKDTSSSNPIQDTLLSNIRAITSFSGGKVLGSEVKYLGSGVYEIRTNVTGQGIFVGSMEFYYQNNHFISDPIQIIIGTPTLSIDTSKISPLAYLNTTYDYTITVTAETGQPVDVDNLEIRISYPSGYQEEVLNLNDVTRKNNGTYTFSYSFKQVEKYSFDIYAEKNGYSKGNSKASVSVAGNTDSTSTGPGPAIGLGNTTWIILILVGIIALYLVIRWRKSKNG